MDRVTIQQREIPPHLWGPLWEDVDLAASGEKIPTLLEEHGYVLLRQVLPDHEVLAARREVLMRLGDVGEVREPVMRGIGSGKSSRPKPEEDQGQFWTSVNRGPALRQVTHGPVLRELMSRVFQSEARPHDLMYLRPMPPSATTSLHYDYPFFAGFVEPIYTAWIPLGDVPLSEGPLVVVEKSHEFDDLLDPLRALDFSGNHENDTVQSAAYAAQNQSHPIDLCAERKVRLLSTNYQAGDLVIFSGFLMHGALDNNSAVGRVRLSCDLRFQKASESFEDRRYFGEQPQGSQGGGYADMRGAQPLFAD